MADRDILPGNVIAPEYAPAGTVVGEKSGQSNAASAVGNRQVSPNANEYNFKQRYTLKNLTMQKIITDQVIELLE